MNMRAALILLTLLIASPLATVGADTSSSILSSSDIGEIVSEINKERQSRGIGALRVDVLLADVAEKRSEFLSSRGELFHTSAPPGTPWPELLEAGYPNSRSGENLALGIETPEELVARWMASPSHRDNLLNPYYEDVGIGVTAGFYSSFRRPVSYVVAFFSEERKESVSPEATRVEIARGSPVSTQSVFTEPIVLAATAEPSEEPLLTASEREKIGLLERLISILTAYLEILR